MLFYFLPRFSQTDLQDLFFRLTMDSFGEIAYGMRLDSLTTADVPYAKAFDSVQRALLDRFT